MPFKEPSRLMATTVEVEPYVKLLDAIFCPVDQDAFWLKFGVSPPGKKKCAGCGELIPSKARDYCTVCYVRLHFVDLVCYNCGSSFVLRKSDYKARLRRRKVPYFFCNKKCYGIYFGQLYGYGRGRHQRVDYSRVYPLWKTDHMSTHEIANTVGISQSTVIRVLHRYPDYQPKRSRQLQPSLKRILNRDYRIQCRCVFCNQVFSSSSELGGHRTKTGELLDKRNMVRVLRHRVTHTLNQTLGYFHISEDVLKKIIRDLLRENSQ